MSGRDPYDPGPIDVEKAFSGDFREYCKMSVWALRLALIPHSKNSPERKYVTGVMVGTWSIWTLGRAAGVLGEAGSMFGIPTYVLLSVVTWVIVSHIWGFETGLLAQVAGVSGAAESEKAKPPAKTRDDDS